MTARRDADQVDSELGASLEVHPGRGGERLVVRDGLTDRELVCCAAHTHILAQPRTFVERKIIRLYIQPFEN